MGPLPRRERPPLILMGVFVLLLLALDRPLPVPEAIRTWAALAAVLLIPGAGLMMLWPGSGRHGWLARLAVSFPLSMIPVTAAALVGRVLGWAPLPVAAGYLFGVFLVVLASLVLSRWRGEDGPSHRRFTAAWITLLAAAAVLCAWSGAPRGAGTDGPDHITTVNEILTTGQFFPRQGLVPAEELNRTDPRKGVLHAGFALAGALAGAPAHRVWTVAPSVLVIPWLALIILLGRRLGLGRGGALLSAALALGVMGGEGGPWVVRLGYGAHAGLVVGWAATWAWLTYAREGRRADLVLVAVLAAVSGAVHPLAPAFFFLPALLMILPAGRWSTVPRGRGWAALLTAAAAAAPVLLVRLREVAGPVNPLHEQVMPVLRMGDWGSVLWPPAGLAILAWPGLAGILLILFVRRFVEDRMGRGYLIAAMLASVGAVWLPGVFDLGSRLASSLPVKLLYMTPYFWVLGAFLTTPWRGGGRVPRAAVVILLLMALPAAAARFQPERVRGWRPAGIDAMLAKLDTLPRRTVVAADPWVSALVAAETHHRPVTVPHQHGHPLDPRGLARLQDLGEILSPWLTPEEALPILTRYRAGYLLLADPASAPGPDGFEEPAMTGMAAARGGSLDRLRAAKFAAWPESYPVVARAPGWTLIAPRRGSESPSPAPVLRAETGSPGGRAVSGEDGSAGGVRLVSLEGPARWTAGEALPVVLWWRRDPDLEVLPVEAHIRWSGPGLDGGGKPFRLIRERLLPGGELRRHREVRTPFLGAWPATAWPPGTALADTIWVALPAALAPGPYEVAVRVRERPMFHEAGLGDLWWERDRWQGAALDTVDVAPDQP